MKRVIALTTALVLLTGCGSEKRISHVATNDGFEEIIVETIQVENIETEEIVVETVKTYELSTTYWD